MSVAIDAGLRFGGACTLTSSSKTRRAIATVAAKRPGARLRGRAHRGVRVRAEVLNDDLADVPVLAVQRRITQCVDSLVDRFADADQQARGERNLKLAGLAVI